MVQGLPVLKTPSKVCEGCLIGKQQIDPFHKERGLIMRSHINYKENDINT